MGLPSPGWAEHGIWSTEAVMRVIGVQSSFAENSYICAESWGGVLGILVRIDDEISADVQGSGRARPFGTFPQPPTRQDPAEVLRLRQENGAAERVAPAAQPARSARSGSAMLDYQE